jgi:hypothetical protein
MPLLTERAFNSSFDCPTKCYLLLNGRRGKNTEYQAHAEESDAIYQRAAIARLQALTRDKDTLHLRSLTSSGLYGSSRLVIINRAEVNECRSDAIVLFRPESKHNSLQPFFFTVMRRFLLEPNCYSHLELHWLGMRSVSSQPTDR